jgi:hypothetical protein
LVAELRMADGQKAPQEDAESTRTTEIGTSDDYRPRVGTRSESSREEWEVTARAGDGERFDICGG